MYGYVASITTFTNGCNSARDSFVITMFILIQQQAVFLY